MANWSDLPEDILILIAKNITNISVHIRFCSVSSSWRRIGLEFRPRLSYQNPLLMIPGACQSSHDVLRKFFPITQIKFHEEHGHHHHQYHDLPMISAPKMNVCRGSYQGWLVMVDSANLDMHLKNPISGVQIELPNAADPPRHRHRYFHLHNYFQPSIWSIRKVVLSRSPSSSSTSECFVSVIYTDGSLGYCKLGDKSWTPIIIEHVDWFTDATYFKGQLYVSSITGETFACDLRASYQRSEFIAGVRTLNHGYLVESGGELLFVVRRECPGIDSYHHNLCKVYYRTIKFEVYKLDYNLNEWVRVNKLGEYALFLGQNQSLSLSELDVGGIKGNRIYFTDDNIHEQGYWKYDTGHDMGVFNLENSTIEPIFPAGFMSTNPSAIWVTPIPW